MFVTGRHGGRWVKGGAASWTGHACVRQKPFSRQLEPAIGDTFNSAGTDEGDITPGTIEAASPKLFGPNRVSTPQHVDRGWAPQIRLLSAVRVAHELLDGGSAGTGWGYVRRFRPYGPVLAAIVGGSKAAAASPSRLKPGRRIKVRLTCKGEIHGAGGGGRLRRGELGTPRSQHQPETVRRSRKTNGPFPHHWVSRN